jgi:hypothetical protein
MKDKKHGFLISLPLASAAVLGMLSSSVQATPVPQQMPSITQQVNLPEKFVITPASASDKASTTGHYSHQSHQSHQSHSSHYSSSY